MATISKSYIGLSIPIQNGNHGYFDQTTDTFSAYKMNIINLIRTKPGERRMNPTFGCRLWNLVFDQNDDFINDKVTKIITEDINKWIPGVSVGVVNVKNIDDNLVVSTEPTNKLQIIVTFTVLSINYSDTVTVLLNTGTI